MYDVVALGELLIDLTATGADEMGFPTLTAHPGGAPANMLAALSAYGCKTAMIAKVGADVFGERLIGALRACSIDPVGVVQDSGAFTTLAFVTLGGDGQRDFSFARKPGADTCLRWSEVDAALIKDCRVFHFGTLSLTDEPAREATQMAVYTAREAGKWVSFDPNLRPPLWSNLDEARTEMLWGFKRADIVKLSEEEADFFFHCPPEEAAGQLHALGVRVVFVTQGERGCLVSGNGICAQLPALSGVKAVDTTGAGDIFAGAALSCLLKTGKELSALTGDDLLEAARFATAAAGLSTEEVSGMRSVPSLDSVLRRLK